jgi:hypothetical protein
MIGQKSAYCKVKMALRSMLVMEGLTNKAMKIK